MAIHPLVCITKPRASCITKQRARLASRAQREINVLLLINGGWAWLVAVLCRPPVEYRHLSFVTAPYQARESPSLSPLFLSLSLEKR